MSQLDHHKTRIPANGSGGKGFRLDRSSGKIWGVCGGIANYFGIDATVVRVGFVLGTLIGFGSFLLVYIAIALIAD